MSVPTNFHIVEKGDTLWNIARDRLNELHPDAKPTGADVNDMVSKLAANSGITDPSNIQQGQVIYFDDQYAGTASAADAKAFEAMTKPPSGEMKCKIFGAAMLCYNGDSEAGKILDNLEPNLANSLEVAVSVYTDSRTANPTSNSRP